MSCEPSCASYIVKVSGKCNSACAYCYYYNGSPEKNKSRMDQALIDRVLHQTSLLTERVKLEWHGGEPLLLGIEAFKRIVEAQRSIERERGTRFKNLTQTNATLIDESWVALFREHDFGLGISLDGPEWLHNTYRVYPSGVGTYNDTCRGIRLLQENGISFGVLAVITRSSIGHEEEIFNFFVDMGIRHLDFLPCAEIDFDRSKPGAPKLTDYSLRPGDLSCFWIRMFDLWLERDDPSIHIRALEQALTGLLGGRPTLCSFISTCSDHFTIEYNGDVGPCSTLSARNLDGAELRFGNIGSETLSEILQGEARQHFLNTYSVPDSCTTCSYFPACGGECAKYRYMWSGDWRETNYFCQDRKRFFSHIVETIKADHPSLIALPV